MAIPNFVSFTDSNGVACQVSNVGEVSSLSITPTTSTPSSTVCTRIRFAGGGFQDVQGSVATTATALGIAATTGPIRLGNVPMGSVALAAYGTDAASTAGTLYYSEGQVDSERVVTSIACLNGTTAVGTDLQIFFIYNSAGTLLGTTALAGTLAATADVFQVINLTEPITIPAGRYFCGFQVNGATTPHQTIATLTYQNATGSLVGVFGTIPATITLPTTTTAGVGPFWILA